MRRVAFISVFVLALTSCLQEEELKKPFLSYAPAALSDGWVLSTPEQENMNSSALTNLYREVHSDATWQVRSLVVFRNGKLVAESYTKDDADRTTPRAIWSATKQVMGLLTGIALEQGIINDINDPLAEYLPEMSHYPDKKDITIKHLLTMRSGISYSNDGLNGQTDDILRLLPVHINDFILSLPLADAPGARFQYKDGDAQLVASAIQARAEMPTSQWAKGVLFDKLEIRNLQWDQYKDGVTLGGFGILTTPRELGKFGQCVLDSGRWKGVQVVNEAWIEEMTAVTEEDVYGSQFCQLWWRDPSREMIFMSGHGGQYVCIIPSRELVVVITSEVNTQGDFQLRREPAFRWVDEIVALSN